MYLLQTRHSVAFCCTVDEVYSAIVNRPVPSAILYSADDLDTLRHLAGISQNRIIDCNGDEKNSIERMALPATIAETVCLATPTSDDSVSLKLQSFVQTGEWAISALNAFCTAPNDLELCKLLAGGDLAYPVARWLETTHEIAVNAARQNYVKRFYSRYWYSAEQTFLPQCWLESFKDRYFAEREKRREASLPEVYNNFQMTRIAMGW